MSQRIAYYRVSTAEQSVASQRQCLGGAFDKEFFDEGISGATPAEQRKGFSDLMAYAREGDVVYVYAIDRLGRDAIDVQKTVRALLSKGVKLNVFGLGEISRGAGEIVLAVLAQVANMERERIIERTAAGRDVARRFLRETGMTHNGKYGLGRPRLYNDKEIREWRVNNGASINETAKHFNASTATIKRACRISS